MGVCSENTVLYVWGLFCINDVHRPDGNSIKWLSGEPETGETRPSTTQPKSVGLIHTNVQFAAGVQGYSWIIAAVISVWVIGDGILSAIWTRN